MSSLKPLVRSPALIELWQRWSEILMWFALKRPDRKRVKPAYYEALYRELIATCQEMATSDVKRRKFYESIAELVSPWLTTRVLERTDRSLLLDLWQRCQQVDRQFGLRASWRKIIIWVLRILVAAGVVGLAVAVTPWARSLVKREVIKDAVRALVGYIRHILYSQTIALAQNAQHHHRDTGPG